MEILLYLAELMQTRKQVGIPGLGTISKKKSPGRYDADTQTFMPPSYTLDFSTELLEQEALAQYISTKRNISIDSANYFIEQFADQVVQDLSDKNEADLGTLGKLTTHNGELNFVPGPESTSGFEYFGLPKVTDDGLPGAQSANDTIPDEPKEEPETIEAIVEENRLEEENPGDEPGNQPDDEQPVYEEISEITAGVPDQPKSEQTIPVPETPVPHEYTSVATPNISYPEEELPEEEIYEKRTPAYIKILLALLALLIIIAVFYFINPKPFDTYLNSLKGNTDTNLVQTEQLKTAADSTAYQDSLQNAADTSLAAPAVNPLDTVIRYEIIVASLRNMKEAKKFIGQMKNKGIETKIVDSMPNNRIKVSIATFTDKTIASKERKRIARELKDPGIYIYTNKPK